ncbi:esterase [Neolewinella aurantiaca]|uniref:Esterase n=1 Tax=Neolewinella aurantiaca TaxID=2602767 RepID=A0A5C7FF60_9BACT|nr:alpha/beta hydrolase [Neolewinella aurantiaca]TXF89804.1 esterase [Neolewinella aurantiaca]
MIKFSVLCVLCVLMMLSCSQRNVAPEGLSLASGKVERVEDFNSKFIPARNVDVWLPEEYSDTRQYAVLYMHDGQMLFDSTTTWNKQDWGVDETMAKLIETGEIRETIVVGIWNTEFRHSEYFPQEPFENLPETYQDSLLSSGGENGASSLFKREVYSDNYLRFLVEELKPFIDSTYSTHPGMENTFVAGSSMGGLISMYAICEYPDVFSGAACLSTHWVGIFDTLNNPIPLLFSDYLEKHLPDPGNHKIYFDYGTETLDALYEPYQIMADSIMTKGGYNASNWKTLKFDGEDHSERAWNKRLDIPLEFLLGKK